ncbi:DUF3348 family protein [Marinobacter sp. VGCF2001]|uniref:DUF3348 family protein n=1 Tax=Marinobacter sp. VGCF2001 TaxID=3417189 RepID=UPI003CF9ADF9
MHNPPVAQARHSHRLLNLLAEIGELKSPDTLPCFGERLSRLFGLGDTMNLDAATAYRCRQNGFPQSSVIDRLTDELASTRTALIRRIQSLTDELNNGTEPGPEAILNAWLALQRKVAASSRQLRDKVRNAMKDQGHAMARLAQLDAVFDHTMAGYTSQCFAQIPRVLEQRFHSLQTPSDSSPDTGLAPDNRLHRYCEDAQNLLLAELDVRLEPVLGLLEACHNEVNHSS